MSDIIPGILDVKDNDFEYKDILQNASEHFESFNQMTLDLKQDSILAVFKINYDD